MNILKKATSISIIFFIIITALIQGCKKNFNLGNNEKKIVVIGCDGIPEALDLIKKGEMIGTVVTNTYSVAKDFYTFEMNIYNNKNIIEGKNCTIDSTGKLVTIPLDGVVTNLD